MIDLDAWSFVAVTYDGSKPSNSPAIYLNGISDGATCAFAFGSSTCQPTAPMNLPRGYYLSWRHYGSLRRVSLLEHRSFGRLDRD